MSDPTTAETPAAAREERAADETDPQRFGRYRVVGSLGEGGMGVVFAARDDELARDVAVKSIRVPRGIGAELRALLIERFQREGRVLASLSHPNVVRVHDVGREDGVPYLVLERLPGPSLRERLGRGPLSPAEAQELGVELAAALEAAHAAGILHRDVKPDNVLASEGGLWVLADFDVARLPRSQLTVVGQFLGTPAYAAPEALLGGEFSEASDIYGWGATLFTAVTGQGPQGERGVLSIAEAHAAGPPVIEEAALRALSPELASAIRSALATAPAARPTARKLRERLARAKSSRPAAWPVPPHVVAVVTLVLGTAIGLVIGWATATPDTPPPTVVAPPPVPAPTPITVVSPEPDPPRPDDEREGDDYLRRWQAIAGQVNRGDYDHARDNLDELLDRYPNDEPALELLDQLEQVDH